MQFSSYESSFKDRAVGKAQLKEFYKFTHPDFFSTAPEDVRKTNEESIQTLNAHLQATQTLNQPAHGTKLKFFVSKDRLLQESKDAKKKKVEPSQEQGFIEVDVELDGIRADVSHTLRQKHYTDTVRLLINSLDEAAFVLESNDPLSKGEPGMSEFRHQLRQQLQRSRDLMDESTVKQPERINKVFARMAREQELEV